MSQLIALLVALFISTKTSHALNPTQVNKYSVRTSTISLRQNYLSSCGSALFAVNNENESVSSSNEKSKVNFDDLLQKELAQFQTTSSRIEPTQVDNSENGILKKVKDVISIVMIVDFFVVIFFLGWFLLAAALKSSNPFFLERFQDIFNPIVVPSLTVLMTGSIASGLLGGGDKKQS